MPADNYFHDLQVQDYKSVHLPGNEFSEDFGRSAGDSYKAIFTVRFDMDLVFHGFRV